MTKLVAEGSQDPGWAARGPPGVQNWDRFLVHPYACRTVLGARWYPHKLPPWGVHGYSSFGWIAVVVSLQDKKGLAPGPEWSLRWAGLAGCIVYTVMCEQIAHRRAPRGPDWAPRGPPGGPEGVQNGVRFLVHPYPCEIGRGDRFFSPSLPPWGAHGYDSFCRLSLDLGEPEQKWYPPLGWAGWLHSLHRDL